MCNTALVVSFACTVLPCSLKHTALVLEEHQAALRKKLQLKQEEYQAKRCAHAPFTLALEGLWWQIVHSHPLSLDMCVQVLPRSSVYLDSVMLYPTYRICIINWWIFTFLWVNCDFQE